MAIRNKIIQNPGSGQDIRFLRTARDTNGFLLEMETSWKPVSTEPPMHYHPSQSEDFKIITGELTVRINGVLEVLKPGDTLHIPPRTAHAMWNSSGEKTVANWKVQPAKNMEQLLETGMGLAKDGKVNKNGMPGILQVALIANRFSGVFRLSSPPFFIQRLVFLLLTPIAWLAGYRAVYKKYLD
jgi:quercetin dioxygenase-like cupin family protein